MSEPLKTIVVKPESAAKSKPVGLYLGLLISVLILFSGTSYLFFSKKGMTTLSALTGMKMDNTQPQTSIATPVLLNIESMPPGARIFINNSFYGTTPAVQKLPLGKYEVRLSLQNYFDWEAQLQLDQEGEKHISVELLAMDNK